MPKGFQVHGYRARKKGKTIRQLKWEFQRKRLIRGLSIGMTTQALAAQLHVSVQTIRDWAGTPEIQGSLAEYERDHFEALDRRFRYSMNLAMEEFVRQLKKKNWKAVDRLITETGILGRMLNYYVTKAERSALPVPVSGTIVEAESVIPAERMSDEMREKSRELLRLARKEMPQLAERIAVNPVAAKITAINNGTGTNGQSHS